MRAAVAVFLGLGVVLIPGLTCFPFDEGGASGTVEGDSISITVLEPNVNRTVAEGTNIPIDWAASNVGDVPADMTITLESRTDLSQTELLSRTVDSPGASDRLNWNTTGYAGPYAIIGRISAGGVVRSGTAQGRITVDKKPTMEFTLPTSDAEFIQGETETLTIAWRASDPNATLRIGLDPDTTHTNDNEIIIEERSLSSAEPMADTLEWEGKDSDNDNVPAGNYNLYGTVSDQVNPVLTVEGLATITVKEPNDPDPNDPNDPNSVTSAGFLEPKENTTFLTSQDSLKITYVIKRTTDVLVDIKTDTDDDHANGNEKTILAQQFVKADTDPNAFNWNGKDTGGTEIGPGIHQLFLVISTGGQPDTVDANALVFRRTAEKQPLIALLEPATVQKVDPGDYITIKWRDEDPNEISKIRIVAANSADPNEHSSDTPILSNRMAKDDGVQDTFAWQVPATGYTPGTSYYFIAYIETEEFKPLMSNSVAGGRFIVNDPTK